MKTCDYLFDPPYGRCIRPMGHPGLCSDRRWTVALRFPDGSELPLEPPSRELDHYEGDLLDSAIRTGIRQATELLDDEDADGYAIVIYKTTKARGTEFDRSFSLEWNTGELIGYRI